MTTSNFPQTRKIVMSVTLGLGVLAVCICAAGLGSAGVYYLLGSRSTTTGEASVEYVLDASPRMEAPTEGGTRLSVAQAVLAEIVRPADTLVAAGLRVFGTGAVLGPCKDTDLIVPLAPASQSRIAESVFSLAPGASVDSALAEAMLAAIRDLSKAVGPQTLVVITGGADSCDAQASALIRQEVERAGIELETFVIGFEVDAQEAQAIKAMIEETAGSTYLNAPDAATLRTILKAIQAHIDHPGTAWQAPGMAYVQSIKDSGEGTFVTSRMSAPQPLVAGSYLEAGEGSRIATGAGFTARLLLTDDIVLWVGPDSEIELTRLASPDADALATQVLLLRGSLLTEVLDPLTPESTYSIISPIGQQAGVTGSVMGTRYDMLEKLFQVDCFEGHCFAGKQALVACQHVSIEEDLKELGIEPAQPEPYAFSEEDLTWDCGELPATAVPSGTPTRTATTQAATALPSATATASAPPPTPIVPTSTPTALPTLTATPLPTSAPVQPGDPPPPPPTNPPPPPPTNPPPTDPPPPPPTDPPRPTDPPPPPADRDGDGLPDDKDGCPDRPGPQSNNGCPLVRP